MRSRRWVTQAIGGTVCSCLFPNPGLAQKRLVIPPNQFACNVDGSSTVAGEVWSFDSSEQARGFVKKVVGNIGLKPNFEIFAADVPNAQAQILNGKRWILYSEVWVQNILVKAGSYWPGVALMAHECAHHYNGDTLGGGDRHEAELAADSFAGSIVARMGGRLEDALSLFKQFPLSASDTHPGRMARLEAVAAGWRSFSKPDDTPFEMLGQWKLTYVDGRGCPYVGDLYVQRRTSSSTYVGYQRHVTTCTGNHIHQDASIQVTGSEVNITYSNPPPNYYADNYHLTRVSDTILQGVNRDALDNGQAVRLTKIK